MEITINIRKKQTAANILKDVVLKAIYDSLKDPLSQNVIYILKSSKPEFQTKKGLCKKVLQDLRKEKDFDK